MPKIEPIETIEPEILAGFDAIIDVRSPAEFAEDHIPGAINLPVLSDAERAEVGTVYKQQSTFKARRIGAALVSRNIARHLEEYFEAQAPSAQFLIYCWRGGMRSGSMATILSQVGWRISVLKGGYKTWRRKVVDELRHKQSLLNFILLDGQTGTAKTEIIISAAKLGLQTIDLEALAAHRGSVFGARVGTAQPSQKHFESLLWQQLSRLDLSRPILVEAESNHIGKCEIPSRLWRSMQGAKHILTEAEIAPRAKFLVSAYGDIIKDTASIDTAITRLTQYHSKETIEDWRNRVEAEEFEELASALMKLHYDPFYTRASARRTAKPLGTITLEHIDAASIAGAAAEIKSIISSLPSAE